MLLLTDTDEFASLTPTVRDLLRECESSIRAGFERVKEAMPEEERPAFMGIVATYPDNVVRSLMPLCRQLDRLTGLVERCEREHMPKKGFRGYRGK
jgi:hypothetical protein